MNNKGLDKYRTPPTEEDFAVTKDQLNPTLPIKSDNYMEEEFKSAEEWFCLAQEADPIPSPMECEFA